MKDVIFLAIRCTGQRPHDKGDGTALGRVYPADAFYTCPVYAFSHFFGCTTGTSIDEAVAQMPPRHQERTVMEGSSVNKRFRFSPMRVTTARWPEDAEPCLDRWEFT